MTQGLFALRTFHPDGSSLTRPVWLIPLGEAGRWAGYVPATSGPVRRIHHDPRVLLARADSGGNPTGPWRDGTASVTSLSWARYRLAFAVLRFASWIVRSRRHEGPGVIVNINLHEPLDEPLREPGQEPEDEPIATASRAPRVDTSAGFVLSAVPPAVLVPVNAVAGWVAAVICAGLVAVGIAVARLARGHPRGPALGGIVGVAISGFFAWRSGSGSGLFLPDIAWELLAITVLTGSLVLRRPLVGLVWRLMEPGRTVGSARARFDVATAGWVVVFAARFVVTQWLSTDPANPFAVTAKVASGLPLTLLAFALTAWAWRAASAKDQRAPRIRRYATCGPRSH